MSKYVWACADCDHLDKGKKQWNENHYCYRYGCTARKADGHICFWCTKDSNLKEGGCSDFRHTEINQQLSFL